MSQAIAIFEEFESFSSEVIACCSSFTPNGFCKIILEFVLVVFVFLDVISITGLVILSDF